MLEIYFDGVLLNTDYYQSLKQKWTMFDETFKLGTTMSREFTLVIPKSVFNIATQNVIIKYMSNDYAHLIIDKYVFSEGGSNPTVTITLVDKMVNANFNYDYSSLVPCTVETILLDICSKMGVTLGNPTDLINKDIIVNDYDNTIQARTYLSFIAELNGGFARIENDGKLYIRTFNNTTSQNIVTDLCENIIIGTQHLVERVVFDNGIVIFQTSSDTTLETLYLNSENNYIVDETIFNNLADKILNFNYCNINTGTTYILPNALVGDVLKLTYNNVDYYTICQFDEIEFLGLWNGAYILNVNSAEQEETKITGNNDKVKAIKIHLNRIDNQLTIAVLNIDENASNISELFISDAEIKQSVQSVVNNLGDNYYTSTQTNQLVNNATEGLINTFSKAGGNNLVMNSALFFGSENAYDYWTGNLKQFLVDYSVTKTSLLLQTGVVTQSISNLASGWLSLKFGFKKVGTGLDTEAQFKINGVLYDLVDEDSVIELSFYNNSPTIDLSFISSDNDEYVVYDLMLNYGQEIYLPYQQASNELKSTTVQISENIKVESSTSNTITILGANGLEGYNKSTGTLVFKQTDTGLYSSFIKTDSAEISDLIIKKVGNQVWITGR